MYYRREILPTVPQESAHDNATVVPVSFHLLGMRQNLRILRSPRISIGYLVFVISVPFRSRPLHVTTATRVAANTTVQANTGAYIPR